MIWVAFALMTFAAVGVVLWPLARSGGDRTVRQSDVDVYADLLAEIDRERQSGLMTPADYASARAEIGRRLIAAEARAARSVKASRGVRRGIAAAAAVAVPVMALGLYLQLGNPALSDLPLAARAEPVRPAAAENEYEDAEIEAVLAKVEQHLSENPDDAQGWSLVAPVYQRMGRVDDAIEAYRNVLRIDGSSYEMEVRLGETLVAKADGALGPEAIAAFERALAHDAEGIQARFYLAMAETQSGEAKSAAEAWARLLEHPAAAADPRQNWVRVAVAQLERLNGQLGDGAVDLPAFAQSTAAREVPGQDIVNSEQIAGMVAGLAARLADEGGSAEEWTRLVRSYTVLGNAEAAQAALADGVENLQNENASAEAEKLIAEARQLGVVLAGPPPDGAANPD